MSLFSFDGRKGESKRANAEAKVEAEARAIVGTYAGANSTSDNPQPGAAPQSRGRLFADKAASPSPSPVLAPEKPREAAKAAQPSPVASTAGSPSNRETTIPVDQAAALTPERREYLDKLRVRLHQQLLERLDVKNLRALPVDIVRQETRVAIRELCQSEKGLLTSDEQERLTEDVMDETFGLGPLEPLLRDPSISDILVNRPDQIYVERSGRIVLSDVRFRDDKHLRQIIDRIVAQVGRRVDEFSPMVDARLADGSRVNAIIPPLALDGCTMSIRRFGSKPLMPEDLIRHGAFPPEVLTFVSAAVKARCNVLISGGTGSGKTTLLNCLSRYIQVDHRIITIEDAAELQLQQPHVVRLETRPANIEGKGEVTQRELVKNSLRMRPDRVIIGECRGGETLDMLQAMNTGHDGSMTTIHANNARDAISRLEVTMMMAGFDLPIRAMRQQIASAINIVVQTQRLLGGRRKVISVTEITGMEGERIQMHDIFKFEQTGVTPDGHADGAFIACGIRPHCLERIAQSGIELSPDLFTRRVLSRGIPSGGAHPSSNGSNGTSGHNSAVNAKPTTGPRKRLISIDDDMVVAGGSS